jgi:hypothetical protein
MEFLTGWLTGICLRSIPDEGWKPSHHNSKLEACAEHIFSSFVSKSVNISDVRQRNILSIDIYFRNMHDNYHIERFYMFNSV